ncbi:hypothetical protein PVL29_017102 [Vitis rotundifolia]|uniref:Uncharacterized protein n=1 Tax=Vitis rotundifolia TaxID=103349 RepID=A0AA38Z9K3_VITRO|nr:hypothetical protein PVL29_017102 [Vitis rotundifolia]
MSIFIILYCVKVNVLSTVIGIQERRPSMNMIEFEFVVPEVFMQLWSNSGLSHTIANDKVMKYRGKLLTQLIMSPENEVKENVFESMDQ